MYFQNSSSLAMRKRVSPMRVNDTNVVSARLICTQRRLAARARARVQSLILPVLRENLGRPAAAQA